MRWRWVLWLILPLFVAVVTLFVTQWHTLWIPLVAVVVWVAVVLFVFWFSAKAFKQSGYALRQHDLAMRSGVLTTQQTIVPFVMVQHVVVNQGIAMRAYGLATVCVYTSSGGVQGVSLSGVSLDEAHQIKQYILDRIENHATH